MDKSRLLKIYCEVLSNAEETTGLLANIDEDTESGITEAHDANRKLALLIDGKVESLLKATPGVYEKLLTEHKATIKARSTASETWEKLSSNIAKTMGWNFKKDREAIRGLNAYLSRNSS